MIQSAWWCFSSLPKNVLQHSKLQRSVTNGETKVASDQELVRATARAIVDKLNSGEVTPLDLLDVLERRIAEVDGKVNALPTLCFDPAPSHAKALMKNPPPQRAPLPSLPVPLHDLPHLTRP